VIESIITISVTGLLAGFIFAMPIAGPISIMITSNALNGRIRYCSLLSLGASFADFTFVFVAVFGLTKLYSLITPVIPYVFSAGSLFLFYLGYKIIRTKIDVEHPKDVSHLVQKIRTKEKGAFYTGLMINFLNPTLFIGALTSSFFVISLIASLGLNTGGLATEINQNMKEINKNDTWKTDSSQQFSLNQFDKIQIDESKNIKEEQTRFPAYFHLVISSCYAFFLALGSLLWFNLLAFFLVRFRHRINIKLLSKIIQSLGILLCLLGVYFGYLALRMFL
jgi:threonine/homoserine/homoserine lactone efflux protein